MVLAIGGCTIEELKERMSYAEAMVWAEYYQHNSPITVGKRLELSVAMLLVHFITSRGGKAQVTDFIRTRTPRVQSLEDMMAVLSKSAMGFKTRKRKPKKLKQKDKPDGQS